VPHPKSIVAAALAIAALLPAPALAGAKACGQTAYSYAGTQGLRKSHGVRATLTPLSAPHVIAGHVAAWVGVGWSGAGPNGQDEWIQAGLNAEAGYAASRLYYEVVRPGAPYTYVELGDVAPGQTHRVSVLEMEHRRGWWRVWVDGQPVTDPVFLPGSHGTWEPVATAESWNAGLGACNDMQFRFDHVGWAQKAGGWWHPLTPGYRFADPGYEVLRSAAATFLTLSRILTG
jgi:hypothetical protein